MGKSVMEPLRGDIEKEKERNGFIVEPKAKTVPAICSCRWALAFVGFFVFVNLYGLRVNMSVAMVCMVNHTATQIMIQEANLAKGGNTTKKISNDENCYMTRLVANRTLHENDTISASSDGEFPWDKKTQSLILSSFFWGYIVTQVPAGWLAQRFGGKRVMAIFMFAAVTSSLLSSVGARASPYMLIALRVINGLGQGAMFPVMQALWSKWAPPLERSKLIGFTYAGAQIGNVMALPLSALLCDYGFDGGWSSIFYVFGTQGMIILVFWMFIVYDSPSQHPRITAEEKHYIESSIGAKKTDKPLPTPWLQFFKCIPFWAIIVAQFCVLWGTFTLLTNIPTYMKEILKFDIKSNGALSAIPYVLFWLCINIGGFASDYMRSKGVKTKNVRKLMIGLSCFPPAAALVGLGFITCATPYAAVVVICVALAFSGFHFPGVMVNHADIAPPFAAVLFGIANSVGTLSGIFGPYTVGLLTPNGTQEEWRHVFYLSAAIYIVGAIVFFLFADGEVQPWVKPYMASSEPDKAALDPIYKDPKKEKNGLMSDERV